MPPNTSVYFPFPIKQILHESHTLSLARYVILLWVESFLYASVKAVGLDWLQPTVRHGGERHAIISVVLEALFRQFSACHRIKFRLGYLPRT